MSEGGGSGAPPSATRVGGGSGAPPSATSVGGGSGAPPSAMSVGGGSGAPPSTKIVAFSEQFPEVADPQAEPNTSTNPRHTSRILPKCIVSSSEVHGVRKNLTPSAKHAWRLRPASVFALERGKSARLSNQQVQLPSNREVSRLMTTDERTRDLPRANCHFVRVFHKALVGRCRLRAPLTTGCNHKRSVSSLISTGAGSLFVKNRELPTMFSSCFMILFMSAFFVKPSGSGDSSAASTSRN